MAGRSGKKKNEQKGFVNAGSDQAAGEGAEADGAEVACGAEEAPRVLELPVLAGTAPCRSTLPAVCLHRKDLKQLALEQGDLVLASTAEGRRTVALCEVGGRAGGVLLAPGIQQSLDATADAPVRLTPDFSAEEAAEVCVEVPADLDAAWAEVGGALQLDKYVKAVLDGTILLAGDVRFVSLGGRTWRLRVGGCARARGKNEAAEPEAPVPCLVGSATRIKLSHEAVAQQRPKNGTEEGPAPAGEATGLARVGGLRAVVEELREAVQMPLERPDLYRRLGVGPPRGVLLYGPPGTGKTLLARGLGEELRCPVELCAATDLIGSGVGESEERITAVFARCRQLAEAHGTGALLFIDEIDALCPKRDDSTEVERRMVAALLTAIDGAKGADGIVVLGATNRPDSIDPAMRRAGRLEREIEVGVPNASERAHILQIHLAGLRHVLTDEHRHELARRAHGYVGADLRSLCLSAARAALRAGRDAVDLEACLAAMRTVPPSALKELLVEVPHVRWGDIGGYAATKEALREAVEWPIRHAWAFQAMHVEPPRGVLLYGPPGCSKTMMAKAVATETEMNFVSIKGPELFSKYVGDSERAVRDVFRKARTAAPCVVFFDEIDAVGANREGEGGGGVAARVLAQLLAEMDGVGAASARRHVVVLAATNRPHVLDPALMRPGRFDRLVHVPLPDEPARTEILRGQLARMQAAEGLDVVAMAARTQGCSGAEIVAACREAALLAIREAVEGCGGEAADEEALCVREAHLDQALAGSGPRIDAETVRFYEDFEKKMQQKS